RHRVLPVDGLYETRTIEPQGKGPFQCYEFGFLGILRPEELEAIRLSDFFAYAFFPGVPRPEERKIPAEFSQVERANHGCNRLHNQYILARVRRKDGPEDTRCLLLPDVWITCKICFKVIIKSDLSV